MKYTIACSLLLLLNACGGSNPTSASVTAMAACPVISPPAMIAPLNGAVVPDAGFTLTLASMYGSAIVLIAPDGSLVQTQFTRPTNAPGSTPAPLQTPATTLTVYLAVPALTPKTRYVIAGTNFLGCPATQTSAIGTITTQ